MKTIPHVTTTLRISKHTQECFKKIKDKTKLSYTAIFEDLADYATGVRTPWWLNEMRREGQTQTTVAPIKTARRA